MPSGPPGRSSSRAPDTQQFRVQGSAAGLGRGLHVPLLTGRRKGASRHGTAAKLPNRLHHNAYVSKDLEATRKFYEDVIGLPLLATWCEKDVLFGAERTYCHCSSGSPTAARSRSSSSPTRRTRSSSAQRCRSRRSITSRCTWTRRRRKASRSGSRRPDTRSRSPSCSSTAIAARSTRPTRTA